MQVETPPFRVRYAETDAEAVAYYGSYFTWFEVGLIELLEALGFHAPEMDARGQAIVTAETFARYHRPARYDERLFVRSRVARAAPKRAVVEHQVVREADGEVLARGADARVLAGLPEGGSWEQATALPLPQAFLDAADERVERIAPLSRRAETLLGPAPPGARSATTEMRVRYAETDSQGIAYYGSYYAWFEAGRTELGHAVGMPYSELERRGYVLPVAEAFCRYIAPLRPCQRFRITTAVPKLEHARATFTNRITALDGRDLAAGYTIHACTRRDGKPRGLPPEVVEHYGPRSE
jgi:acyl-CoA thioester hydrolase